MPLVNRTPHDFQDSFNPFAHPGVTPELVVERNKFRPTLRFVKNLFTREPDGFRIPACALFEGHATQYDGSNNQRQFGQDLLSVSFQAKDY